jgi:hypothetical protein
MLSPSVERALGIDSSGTRAHLGVLLARKQARTAKFKRVLRANRPPLSASLK